MKNNDQYLIYEKKLIDLLIGKYRRSKKDKGTNIINRRTVCRPSEIYPRYYDNNADISKKDVIFEIVKDLKKKNMIDYEMKHLSADIEIIVLSDTAIETMEEYHREKYGVISRDEKLEKAKEMADKYRLLCSEKDDQGAMFPCTLLAVEKLENMISRKKCPADMEIYRDVLKALYYLEKTDGYGHNKLYIREFSMLVFGDSKRFEDSVMDRVCNIIRTCKNKPAGENELNNEILSDYDLVTGYKSIVFKGDVILTVNSGQNTRCINAAVLPNGIEIDATDIGEIENVKVNAGVFLTVENLTSYRRLKSSKEIACMYLGGFSDRYQRDFIKKLHNDNPDVAFKHFGDMDAGGLLIYENLCKVTGVEFGLYNMSKEVLADERYADCLKELTAADRVKLEGLGKCDRYKESPEYREMIEYMLYKGVKLEQEIVALYETTGS